MKQTQKAADPEGAKGSKGGDQEGSNGKGGDAKGGKKGKDAIQRRERKERAGETEETVAASSHNCFPFSHSFQSSSFRLLLPSVSSV